MKALVLAPLDTVGRKILEAKLEVEYAGWALGDPVVTPQPTDEEIVALARGAEAIIVPGELSTSVIEKCPNLSVIGVARGDPRGVDLSFAEAKGIAVVYAAGRNAAAVADLTLAFVLMLFRQLIDAHNFVREKRWRTWDDLFATPLIDTIELSGRVIGLVGFGYVGKEVARRARAFDMRIVVYDPYVEAKAIRKLDAEKIGLQALMAEADVVSIHVKLSDETRGLIGAEELERMRSEAFLINTARAAVVDRNALYDALKEGRIAGAALDVYWDEPLSLDSPFIGLPNVIHTPHIGGATREVEVRTAEMVARDVIAALEGGTPKNPAYT